MSTTLSRSPAAGPIANVARMRRIVATSFVGNVLELFDFAAYGYFAAVIGRQFFPADNPTVSLMASLGVFAAGFIARPIGGILFGHVADRIGRAPALLGSVALMAFSTFLIGLLPTYAQIGAAAPILLVVMRLLQGASVGGEFTTSVVYAVEHAPPHRRALIGSASSLGATSGMLLGSGVGVLLTALLSPDSIESWGWRVPFLLGIVLGVVGYLTRRNLSEVAEAEAPAGPAHAGLPVVAAIRTQWRALLQVMGIACLMGVGFYILFVYSVTYLSTILHHSIREAFNINTIALLVMLVTIPAGAALSDRIGRKPLLGGCAVLLILLTWPLLHAMHSADSTVVLLAQCGFACLVGPLLGTMPALLVEAFPRDLRCSAASVAYNLSMAVFGGLSPMVATWLISRTQKDMAPAYLVIGAAVVALIAVLTLRETARRPLR
jgi:MHS family proline/betaine transporter-like MFS transporter